MFKKMSLLVATVIGLLFTFGSEDSYKTTVGADSGGQTVTLATVNWESEIASTNVLAQVLKEAGFNVQITTVDPAIMFSSVAEGQLDAIWSTVGCLQRTRPMQRNMVTRWLI